MRILRIISGGFVGISTLVGFGAVGFGLLGVTYEGLVSLTIALVGLAIIAIGPVFFAYLNSRNMRRAILISGIALAVSIIVALFIFILAGWASILFNRASIETAYIVLPLATIVMVITILMISNQNSVSRIRSYVYLGLFTIGLLVLLLWAIQFSTALFDYHISAWGDWMIPALLSFLAGGFITWLNDIYLRKPADQRRGNMETSI